MKKILVHAALSLSMLIFITSSVYSPWIQTNWPASNSFFSLYSSQDRVFARTWDSLNGGRMFLTADDGANWTQISSADSDIDILSIVMSNSNIIAGTWNGLYLSTDGGTTWNAVTPAGIPADTAIWSLALIDTTLFAGTTGDIYKSSDDGNTWTEANSGIAADARITSIVASEDAIFAGSASNGVFKTANGGTSWTAINSGLTDTHISQLAVIGTRLLAVTLNGVFISDNNGSSWAADSSGLEKINCFAVVDNQLFAGTDDEGAYLSVDSGATWTSYSSGLPANTRVWSLAASGDGIFAGTDSGVWRIPISTARFTITASASVGGTVSPAGDIIVYENSSQTFTITPDLGFAVSDVLVDEASVGAVASYTFSKVTANHSISAFFHSIPTAVTNVGIAKLGSNQVQVTWDAAADATGYEVWYAPNAPYFAPGSNCANPDPYDCDVVEPATTTSFTHLALGDPASNWTFLVRAVNGDAVSPLSEPPVGEFEFSLTPGSP
jgi:hypothetical protein